MRPASPPDIGDTPASALIVSDGPLIAGRKFI
jgi:hypothetical protein